MHDTSIADRQRHAHGPADSGDLRTHLHGMWSAVAGSWEEHADFVDARHADLSERMLDLVAPQPGDHVLELACGPGGLGLAAARRVGPGGDVVLSDVVEEMTAVAAARADLLGFGQVRTRRLDLEQIDEPDGEYDIVLCRDGLQFAVDPARGAREIRRVLRPGGRAALAVWGPRARNPWLGVVLDVASTQLGRPMPPPGVPGPFALDDQARLDALLTDAGLTDATITELSVPLHAGTFDEWWARTCALAGPVATILQTLPEDRIASLRAAAQDAVQPYRAADGFEFPGVALLASARRPG